MRDTTKKKILAIDLGATSSEALVAGILAGITGLHVKDLVSDPATSFFLEHLISAAAGAPAFALLGTALRFQKMYWLQKEEDADLTYQDFWAEHGFEAARFCLALGTAGGGAFVIFTMLMAGLKEGLGSLPSKALAVVVACLVFALANTHQDLHLPLVKLLQIVMVFFGFAGGAYAVERFELTGALGAVMPAFGASAAALATAGTAELIARGRARLANLQTHKSQPVRKGPESGYSTGGDLTENDESDPLLPRK